MKKVWILLGVVLLIISVSTYLLVTLDSEETQTPAQPTSSQSNIENQESSVQEESAKPETQTDSTETLLTYLIEEEKLAHDVYVAMGNLYGTSIFGNIASSEITHQERVLPLLSSRNIPDPRSTEVGVFTNAELQSLYNVLIAKGTRSLTDAYEVGVIIEEKDIADITKQLATATDADVIETLEFLKNGSENHLRAFNRQLQ